MLSGRIDSPPLGQIPRYVRGPVEDFSNQGLREEITAEEGRLDEVSGLMPDLTVLEDIEAAGQLSLRESSDACI